MIQRRNVEINIRIKYEKNCVWVNVYDLRDVLHMRRIPNGITIRNKPHDDGTMGRYIDINDMVRLYTACHTRTKEYDFAGAIMDIIDRAVKASHKEAAKKQKQHIDGVAGFTYDDIIAKAKLPLSKAALKNILKAEGILCNSGQYLTKNYYHWTDMPLDKRRHHRGTLKLNTNGYDGVVMIARKALSIKAQKQGLLFPTLGL